MNNQWTLLLYEGTISRGNMWWLMSKCASKISQVQDGIYSISTQQSATLEYGQWVLLGPQGTEYDRGNIQF